jgi:sugar O-acyltransferase (sialic acid O-acetyltransferase NeuD family)
MDKPVIILGAGTIGQAAQAIFDSNGVVVYCFLDDDPSLTGTEINEITVLGSMDDEAILGELGGKTEVFIATDENAIRTSLVQMLKDRDVMPVNAIHQASEVSRYAHLGHGNFIDSGSIINSNVKIGSHCLIMSGSIVDHGSTLEDFVQIGIGSQIGAGATIGKSAFIGSGVTIVPGISIGANARIGAGSIVIENVKKNQTVFGNPAKAI